MAQVLLLLSLRFILFNNYVSVMTLGYLSDTVTHFRCYTDELHTKMFKSNRNMDLLLIYVRLLERQD